MKSIPEILDDFARWCAERADRFAVRGIDPHCGPTAAGHAARWASQAADAAAGARAASVESRLEAMDPRPGVITSHPVRLEAIRRETIAQSQRLMDLILDLRENLEGTNENTEQGA